MGLDNGIDIKFRKLEELGKDISPKIFKNITKRLTSFDNDKKDVYDLLYWRKCYNIRELFRDFCNENEINFQDGDITYLTLDKTIRFIDCLLKYHNKKWWNGSAGHEIYPALSILSSSIWEWDDIKKNYKHMYKEALKFLKYLKKSKVLGNYYTIYFYDSY